jgi:hypothetical protein
VIAGTTFDGNYEGLIDTLSAGTWSALAVPSPGGQSSTDVQLSSVACGDTNNCVATGLIQLSGVNQGLMETLSSGSWTATVAPTPAGTPATAGIEIHNVACPAVGTCVADGQSDVAGSVNGLFWNLTGGAWVVTTTPLPADANASSSPSFAPITCPGAGVCLAVGTYLGSGGREGVVETDPSLAPSVTTLNLQRASSTAVTYAASVTGSAGPTGTVVFSAGLNTMCSAPIVKGTATCSGPVPAARTVLGSYSGDGGSAPSWGTGASPVVPPAIASWWGQQQNAKINTWFPFVLQARVTDSTGAGVAGVPVTFMVPNSGASAVLWGSAVAVTNVYGIATAPVVSANPTAGSYIVWAFANGVPSPAYFYMTNTKR